MIERKRALKGSCMLDRLPDVAMAIMDICIGIDTEVKVEEISAWKDGRDIVIRISDCLPCASSDSHHDDSIGTAFIIKKRLEELAK